MNNVLALTKVYVKQFIARLTSYITKKKSKNIVISVLMFVLFAGIIAMATFQFVWGFAMPLKAMQLEQFIITYGLIVSVFLSLIIVAFEIPGHFYKNKDYEMLASLPLRNWEVVTAKIITAYISIFLYSLILIVPTFVAYFLYNPINVLAISMAVISLVFLPMFVLLVGCVLGFFIHIFTSRLRNKTLFSTIFMFFSVIAIMGISFLSASKGLPNIIINGETPFIIKIILRFIYFLNAAIAEGNVLYFLYFVLINIAYLALAIWVISFTYTKINSLLLTTKVKASNKPLSFKQQTPFWAMVKKEAKSFFGSSIWTVNVLVGPIMIFILTITLGIVTKNMLVDPIYAESKDYMVGMMNIMYLGFVPLMVGMCATTSSSISMEGKKIQILKQLPISFNTMAFSKILFSFLLIYPPVAISSLIYLALVYTNIAYAIAFLIIPAVFIFACSVGGLLINLRFPKLIWKKEVEVVKQSASIFIAVTINMFISVIPMVLFFIFIDWFLSGGNYLLFIAIMLAWTLAYLMISLMLLKHKGKKMFEKIS